MNYPALTSQALTWLRNLQPRIEAKGSIKIATSSKVAQQVITWCMQHDIIGQNSLNLPHVQFGRELLTKIEQVQQQLCQASFRDNFSNKARLDSALKSDQELKTQGLTPRDSRVLVRLVTAQNIVPDISVQIIDVDWQQLDLTQFTILLVVENLDCFYQLDKFLISQSYSTALIVYRGDMLYGKAVKALKSAWLKTGNMAVYFGDFDAAGISIALSEHYNMLLLPAFNHLNTHASAAMLPDKQLKYIDHIQQYNTSADFRPYRRLLCQQLKGYRQQKMQNMKLVTVILVD